MKERGREKMTKTKMMMVDEPTVGIATNIVEQVFEIIDGIRQSPYSPVDGRPMKRADAREVTELIDSD